MKSESFTIKVANPKRRGVNPPPTKIMKPKKGIYCRKVGKKIEMEVID
jgi:hypothetical protein